MWNPDGVWKQLFYPYYNRNLSLNKFSSPLRILCKQETKKETTSYLIILTCTRLLKDNKYDPIIFKVLNLDLLLLLLFSC